ncbi:MAG: tol-pal system protein YbgF [Pseudomonadota bacterium]
MNRTLQASILTAAALAAVAFSPVADAQRARETLSERVARLEQQVATTGNEETQRTLSELLLRLDDLQREVQNLRGMVEDQSFDLQQLKNQQRDQYLDLDRRLSQVGTALPTTDGPAPTQAPPPVPTTVLGDGRPVGQRELPGESPREVARDVTGSSPSQLPAERPEVRAPIDAGLTTTGLGTDPNQAVVAVADPAQEKAAYDVAFESLKQGRYAESARRFDEFLKAYPDGEFADNAQYWLAESYYVTGNYRIALDAFQTLTTRFPDSSKAQDATLKLAFTYYELKQYDAAEESLNQVLRQYPNTTVARLAENRLRTMRIEGHIR